MEMRIKNDSMLRSTKTLGAVRTKITYITRQGNKKTGQKESLTAQLTVGDTESLYKLKLHFAS